LRVHWFHPPDGRVYIFDLKRGSLKVGKALPKLLFSLMMQPTLATQESSLSRETETKSSRDKSQNLLQTRSNIREAKVCTIQVQLKHDGRRSNNQVPEDLPPP